MMQNSCFLPMVGPDFGTRPPWLRNPSDAGRFFWAPRGLGSKWRVKTWGRDREAAFSRALFNEWGRERRGDQGASMAPAGQARPRVWGSPAAGGAFAFTGSGGGRARGRENGSAAPAPAPDQAAQPCRVGPRHLVAAAPGRQMVAPPGVGGGARDLAWGCPGPRVAGRGHVTSPRRALASPVGLSRV